MPWLRLGRWPSLQRLRINLAVAGFCFLLGLMLVFALLGFYTAPRVLGNGSKELVNVSPGENAAQIGGFLERKGIIRSAVAFALWVRLNGLGTKLQAGVYALGPGMSLEQVIGLLVEGKVTGIRLTIPEGFTVDQIASLLQAKGIVSRRSFAAATTEGRYGLPFTPGGPRVSVALEGYLFPATYRFYPKEKAKAVVGAMTARFRAALTAADLARIRKAGWSVPQVVTLASIVQREAKYKKDMPVVAAIFANRLHLGMPLQSDATIEYILPKTKAALTLSDIRRPSPYNTYLHSGLPPGPICNPGEAAIRAVIHPAKVGYLYFFNLPNGKTVYADTYTGITEAEKKAGL